MTIQPILPSDAPENVKTLYEDIRAALDISHLPIFFLFFGNAPRYLSHISKQIIRNLNDPAFDRLIQDTGDDLLYLTMETLTQGDEIQDWKSRYRHSPSFVAFEQDIDTVFRTNMKLVVIFLALREAVKGWAVAAKKLPSQTRSDAATASSDTGVIQHHVFIFEDHKNLEAQSTSTTTIERQGTIFQLSTRTQTTTTQIVKQSAQIEKSLLPEYLALCQNEFASLMKQTHFWILRVRIEEMLLQQIHTMPHAIQSPVNLVHSLVDNDKVANDLLHLLSEQFPVLAVQRLMYSGFMKG